MDVKELNKESRTEVRMTVEEKALITQRAKYLHMTVSQYLLFIAFQDINIANNNPFSIGGIRKIGVIRNVHKD